jgi:hypothetical protein
LEYPKHLHNSHSSFPLAVESKEITYDMLSPYAKDALKQTSPAGTAKNYKQTKLLGTFCPKRKYTLHYLNLALYISLGMILVKVHGAIRFKQTRHLKPYIEMAMKKRAEATTKSKKQLMKLLVNGCYGKI